MVYKEIIEDAIKYIDNNEIPNVIYDLIQDGLVEKVDD